MNWLRGAGRQAFRARQRRGRHQERDDRDDRHHNSPPRQPMGPTDRAHRQLGQQHARDEPGHKRGRPVHRADPERGVERDEGPAQAQHPGGGQHGDSRPDPHPPHQQRDHGQRQIEAHLHGQAPHLGQPRGERQRHVDLGQRQVGQPDGQVGLRVGQQGQNHHDRNQVRGHDADQARPKVVPGRRDGAQTTGRGGMAAPQQEARQREEHRDGEVEPAEQPSHYPAGVPGLKGDVGDDDPDGRAGPHSLDRRQEASGYLRHPRALGTATTSVPGGYGSPENG